MEDNVAEGIIGRKLVLCPKLQTFEMDELVRSCGHCDNFLVYCCSCSKRYDNDSYREEGRLCHHFRLIFTDGACRSNGRDGATAGIGVAATEDDSGQWSIPVTGDLDMGQKRTSQRAELLAAQAGLRYLIISSPDEGRRKKGRKSGSTAESRNWIIATDSEYVVKGVTEWLPAWKQNNLRTNRNTVPANLDLFLYLDEELTAAEMKLNVKIGFWHVRREYNRIADGLAKKAALEGDPE